MKELKFLIVHCTATPEGRPVTKEDIINWHIVGRGWKQVGYSDMILLNGTVLNLVSYDDDKYVEPWEITNGVAGINGIARHFVYVGGTDIRGKAKDTRTSEQRISMVKYVHETIKQHPGILIGGHNQFANKACPSFDVPRWLKGIGVEEKNIYYKPHLT